MAQSQDRKPRHRRRTNFGHRPPPTQPIETRDGIKARSQSGSFARNWWATRWIEALERLVDPGRLARGQSYARLGQLLSISETPDGIEAIVQGSRRKPYKVLIRLKHLSKAQWHKVIDAMSQKAVFAAKLLAGEMPEDIDAAFRSAGVALFPTRKGDLYTSCTCPDWANPCKHVAAAHYILAERFDEDPFLLFRMRGRSQEQILQDLRMRRAGQTPPKDEEEEPEEQDAALEESLLRYWEAGADLESFPLSISQPAIEMPVLKRLGEASFAPEPGLPGLLQNAYQFVSQAALAIAFADAVQSNGQNDS
jgi:uncharacterized Zn finger protein